MSDCLVDWDDPLAGHPLNVGRVAWWLAGDTSPYWGAPLYRDIVPKSSSGGGNHGTLTGGPAWQGPAGRPGGWGSVSFDGSDDYVDCGTGASLGITGDLTIAGWFLTVDGSRGAIFNHLTDSSADKGYAL